jgi:hypothetical protein
VPRPPPIDTPVVLVAASEKSNVSFELLTMVNAVIASSWPEVTDVVPAVVFSATEN